MKPTSFKSIGEKYDWYANDANPDHFQNGDVINVYGTSVLSAIISSSDKQHGEGKITTHSELCMMLIVNGVERRVIWQAIEAEAGGVIPMYLSDAVKNGCSDFRIIRANKPQPEIDAATSKSYGFAESGIPYDKWALPKILWYEMWGRQKAIHTNYPNKQICSGYRSEEHTSELQS